MDKIIKLHTYVDGVNDTPFPNSEDQIEIGEFRYDAKRMGGAPTISCTIMYETCLDNSWSDLVYAEFNGEKYYLKQTPTSSKNNEDGRYKHNVEFVSERIILDNTYYFDAVTGNPLENDKPVTNSTKFHFYGNIYEYVKKMNASLQYTKLQSVDENGYYISGYRVVVDEEITSDSKQISFDDAAFSQALQECFNTFGIPFYFVGKEIHVGFTNNAIDEVLEYGVDDALLSVMKNNSNFKVVNRATGMGSTDNIPYYYPNNAPKGEIEAVVNTTSDDFQVKIEDYEKFSNNVKIGGQITFVNSNCVIKDVDVFYADNFEELGVPYNDIVTSDSSIVRGRVRFDVSAIGNKKISFRAELNNFKNHEGESISCSVSQKWNINEKDWIEESSTYDYFFDKVGIASIPFACHATIRDSKGALIDFYSDGVTYADITLYIELSDKDGWLYEDNNIELSDIGLSITSGAPMSGDTITQKLVKKVNTSDTLQPSIYRTTDAKERFYNAVNYPFEYTEGYVLQYGEYLAKIDEEGNESEVDYVHNDVFKKDDGTYYTFVTPYVEGHPREHVFTVDDIKPTIKEATNNISWTETDKEGKTHTVFQRMDMFAEFAYDDNDNDETYLDENGKEHFKHPYFFAKLRKLDFNLFDHAIENGAMTFSMTSGHCGACNFEIGVSEDEPQYNTVQVYEERVVDEDGTVHEVGSLKRDEEGRVLCGLEDYQDEGPMQPRQQDTINYEVWIALKKEEDTYGVLMPKAPVYNDKGELVSSAHRPVACSSSTSNDGDTFVIINISLPEEYILRAEKKLEKAIVKYIWENNEEKFNFSVTFSRIFLEENATFAQLLNENARLVVKYNNEEYTLYVSSFSYQMSEGEVLPNITVELDDTLTIAQNALQRAIDGVRSEIGQAINALDVAALGARFFLRKDIDDTCEGTPYFKKGISFGEGGEVEVMKDGSAKLSIDYLEVTKKATFTSLEIQERTHAGGQILVTPAAMTCSDIAEVVDESGSLIAWRCYFQTSGEGGEEIFNTFAEGDQAICQTFNEWGSKYYWRLVTEVGDDYIDLSNVEGEYDEESDAPSIGDKIIQLGNRNNEERQNAIVIAAHGEGSPYIIQYKGINTFALTEDKIVTKLSSTENIFTGIVNISAGSTGLENIGLDINVGGQNMLRNSSFTGDYLSEPLANESVLEAASEMYGGQFQHWTKTDGVSVVELPNDSASGYGVYIASENDSLSQELYHSIIRGESYVVSFKAKSDNASSSVTVTCGGASESFVLTSEWQKKVFKFTASESGKNFVLHGLDCSLCEIQLERGTIDTAWSMSLLDNSSDRAYYQSLNHLDNAMKASTTIAGGLVLTNTIQVGNYANEIMTKDTGGMSGTYTKDEDPFLWGGGTLEQANNAIQEKGVEEANFVVTHGGKVIANDAVIRGTVYATDGEFSGKVNAKEGNLSEGFTIGDTFRVYTEGNQSGMRFINQDDYDEEIDQYGGVALSNIGFSSTRYTESPATVLFQPANKNSRYSALITKGMGGFSPVGDINIALVLGAKNGYAIYCKEGMYAGLRPSARVITEAKTSDSPNTLLDLDYSVLVNLTSGTCYIELPKNPLDGQEYYIESRGANMSIKMYQEGYSLYSGNTASAGYSVTQQGRALLRFKYYADASLWVYSWLNRNS